MAQPQVSVSLGSLPPLPQGGAVEGLAYRGESALGSWDGGWRERGPDWLAQQRSQIVRLTPELI